MEHQLNHQTAEMVMSDLIPPWDDLDVRMEVVQKTRDTPGLPE